MDELDELKESNRKLLLLRDKLRLEVRYWRNLYQSLFRLCNKFSIDINKEFQSKKEWSTKKESTDDED